MAYLTLKFFLLKNVKIPTVVGILTFTSMKNSITGLSEPEKDEYLNIFIIMSICAEKTKLMTNSPDGIQRGIKVKGQKLGTVTSFKYLEAVVSDDVSKSEILSRTAQSTAALTKLKPIWKDNKTDATGGC